MSNLVHKNAATSGVEKIFGTITVDEVRANPYTDKKLTAQVRQVVTNVYPGVRGGNSLQDALFADEQFGAESQEFTEQRVAFLDVPLNSNAKTVTAQLKKYPKARIYRILSINPILTKEQENALRTGLSEKTMEDYRANVALDKDSKPLEYKGRNFYRATKFSTTEVADIDLRDEELVAEAQNDLQLASNETKSTVKA